MQKYNPVTKKEYVYTVDESAVPKGYSKSVSGTTITNTKIPLISLEVTKQWRDNAGFSDTRPDVKINLLQNGKKYQTWDLAGSVSAKPDDTFSHEFTNLPKTDELGKDYHYTITEDEVASLDGRKGYITSVTGDVSAGFTVTNKWSEEDLINIAGEKIWQGDGNPADAARPSSIALVLYRDGVEYKHATASAENGWKFEFSKLPKHQDGSQYFSHYEIIEAPIKGYTTSIPPIEVPENIAHGGTVSVAITNVFNNNVVAIEGQKSWVGDEEAERPQELTVNLLQNSTHYSSSTTNAAADWKYKFESLPKYDSNNKAYVYTVEEAAIPEGYSMEAEGNNITNTKIPLIDIQVNKTWIDNVGFTDAHPDITINLLRDGKEIDQIVLSDPTVSHVFSNLPKTDKYGKRNGTMHLTQVPAPKPSAWRCCKMEQK